MKYLTKTILFTQGMILMMCLWASGSPIRIMIFTPCGLGGFVMSAIEPAMRSITKILTVPTESHLNLSDADIPTQGFKVESILWQPVNTTTAHGDWLVAALPKTDVAIAVNNTKRSLLFTPLPGQAS